MGKDLQRGITLIALVITIIVLLILAGVSITAMIGENGIATKSKSAKENTRAAEVEERVILASNENDMNDYVGGSNIDKISIVQEFEKEGKLTKEEADALLGRDGKTEIDVITIGEIEINFGVLNTGDTTAPKVDIVIDDAYNGKIYIIVNAIDSESGLPENVIYNYYVKYSTAETEYSDEALYSGTESVCTLTVPTDNSDLIYDVKVTVSDVAGNIGFAEVKNINMKIAGCFVENTKISTAKGFINVEDIRVGDKVYTYNEETRQIEEQEVLNTFIHETNEIITLTFANGEQIQNTNEHPYYVVEKGWTRTRNLNVGDRILTQYNEEIEIENIKVNKVEKVTVYNINTDVNHNYFVGLTKFLVHNKS